MKTKSVGILLIAGLIVLSAMIVFATPASATTATIYPSEDSWVDSNDLDKNKGDDKKLHVRYKNGDIRRTYIKADLSCLPDGVTINSATLYLYKDGGDNAAWDIGAYTVSKYYTGTTNLWTESGITWDNAPTDFTLISTTSVATPNKKYKTWDVTSAAQAAYASSDKTLSLALKLVDETSTSPNERHHDFNSNEKSGTDKDPYIVITYSDTEIPEFSTIAIPVAAILGLLFLFNRRKRRSDE